MNKKFIFDAKKMSFCCKNGQKSIKINKKMNFFC